MSREINSDEKRVLREVMGKIVKSTKPLAELEQEARDMLRQAAAEVAGDHPHD